MNRLISVDGRTRTTELSLHSSVVHAPCLLCQALVESPPRVVHKKHRDAVTRRLVTCWRTLRIVFQAPKNGSSTQPLTCPLLDRYKTKKGPALTQSSPRTDLQTTSLRRAQICSHQDLSSTDPIAAKQRLKHPSICTVKAQQVGQGRLDFS